MWALEQRFPSSSPTYPIPGSPVPQGCSSLGSLQLPWWPSLGFSGSSGRGMLGRVHVCVCPFSAPGVRGAQRVGSPPPRVGSAPLSSVPAGLAASQRQERLQDRQRDTGLKKNAPEGKLEGEGGVGLQHPSSKEEGPDVGWELQEAGSQGGRASTVKDPEPQRGDPGRGRPLISATLPPQVSRCASPAERRPLCSSNMICNFRQTFEVPDICIMWASLLATANSCLAFPRLNCNYTRSLPGGGGGGRG